MARKNLKWFGFNITQKQSVQIFILSLIGFIISLFLILNLLYMFIINFMYSIIYGYYDITTIFQIFLSTSPFFISTALLFFISIYSGVRSRQIGKYYTENFSITSQAKDEPIYCSNCGQPRLKHKKFCPNCGEAY